MAKKGRPSKYTKAIAEQICNLVTSGSNLNKIGASKKFPVQSTIYLWLRDHSEFSNDYARAREIRSYARSDRMDDIAQRVIDGKLLTDRARIAMDNEKWQAGKENQKTFGDQITQNLKGGISVIKIDDADAAL